MDTSFLVDKKMELLMNSIMIQNIPSAEFDQENGRERIIFIKNEQGEYEFYGLYQCEVVNSNVKPFERKYVLLQEIL